LATVKKTNNDGIIRELIYRIEKYSIWLKITYILNLYRIWNLF
jgi:hypothetical protein